MQGSSAVKAPSGRAVAALITLCSLALAGGADSLAQQPPRAGTPGDTASYNSDLTQQLEAKASAATVPQQQMISGPRGSVTITVQVPSNSSNVTVMGQILVRDTYVAQLTAVADEFEQLLASPDRLSDTVRDLRRNAGEVDSAYRNMVASEQDVSRLGTRTRSDPRGIYEADMRRAQQLEAKGDSAGAEAIRQNARGTAYGNFVQRRQRFFDLLDEHRLLGLGERNLFLPDDFLFKALRNTLDYNAPHGDYVELTRSYIQRAVDEARKEARRAAAVNSVHGLNEFGGPKYARTRDALDAIGRAHGSDLPHQFAQAAAGGYEMKEGAARMQTEITNFGLNLIAGGAWIIPGVGPLISGGAAAIQVFKEGNELVIAVLDAEDARNVAPVTGYTRIITAEDRVKAEAGEFGLALAGAFLEGVSAVRVVRGPPPAPAAGAAGDAATAAARNAPGPGAAPTPAAGTNVAEAAPVPPGAGRSAAGEAPAAPASGAPGALSTTPRSSGVLDETIQRAREQARKHGIDESRIDAVLPDARGQVRYNQNIANQARNPVAETNSFLSNLAELDDIAAGAVSRGVPQAQVDAAVRRAADAVNDGSLAALDDLRGNLRTMEVNARGDVVFMDDAAAFANVSPDVMPSNVVNGNAGDMIRLDVRVRSIARGTLDELDPNDLALLHDLQAYGDDIYRWRAYDGAVDLDPVFQPGFREAVNEAYPNGLPPVPPGVTSRTPLPGRPGSATSGGAPATAGGAQAADDSVTQITGVNRADDTPTRLEGPPAGAADDTPTRLEGPPAGAVDDTPTRLEGPPAGAVDDTPTRIETGAGDTTRLEPPPGSVASTSPPEGAGVPAGAAPEVELGIDLRPASGAVAAAGAATSRALPGAPGAPATGAAGDDTDTTEPDAISAGGGSAPLSRELPGIEFTIRPMSEVESETTALDLVSDPGFLSMGFPVSNDARNPLVQRMIVDFRVSVPRTTASGQPRPPQPDPPALRLLARRLVDALRAPFGPSRVPPALLHIVDAAPVPSSATARPRAARQSRGAAGGAAASSPLRGFLVSLGTSTGEAFQLQLLNEGRAPLDVSAQGLIVEPLTQAAQKEVQRQITQLAARNPVTVRVNAYCAEFLRTPPSAGTVFRIAAPELQQQFAPLRSVLHAAQRLEETGLLQADAGNPMDYIHSIRQWSIWSREQEFSLDGFRKAFVEHAKKNVEAAGHQWSRQLEAGFGELVPYRWKHITAVLREAAR